MCTGHTNIVTGASPQGSVSVIRLSGMEVWEVAQRVFRPGGKFQFKWLPESHRVYYGTAVNSEEQVLDEVRKGPCNADTCPMGAVVLGWLAGWKELGIEA
jgi:hypothetical protein